MKDLLAFRCCNFNAFSVLEGSIVLDLEEAVLSKGGSKFFLEKQAEAGRAAEGRVVGDENGVE